MTCRKKSGARRRDEVMISLRNDAVVDRCYPRLKGMSTGLRLGPTPVEDLGVAAVQLVVGEVGVALRDGDAAVTGELLSHLEIPPGAAQHGGHKVVPGGMRGHD